MKGMHSYGWLDQPPFLFGSAKNIEHLALCCVGASAQSHNCSVSARVQMHPRLRPAMCIVLCIIVCQISHVKHQLLIQRLVLFFYPHGGSKALAARAFPDIFLERYPDMTFIDKRGFVPGVRTSADATPHRQHSNRRTDRKRFMDYTSF